MVIGRDARRAARLPTISAQFPRDAEAALDVLALADMAWHDTYSDLELPTEVVDDLLVLSRNLSELISAVTLALADWRDLRVNADKVRKRSDL